MARNQWDRRDDDDWRNDDDPRSRSGQSERRFFGGEGDEERWHGRDREDWGRENWGTEHGPGRGRFGRGGFGRSGHEGSFGENWSRGGTPESYGSYGRSMWQGGYNPGSYGGYRSSYDQTDYREGGTGRGSWGQRVPSEGSYGRGSYGAGGYGQGGYGQGTYRDYGARGYGQSWAERGGSTGGFSGKGPKGYTRSDDRIREDVCDRLSEDDEIDASDITVTVSQGQVTLEGTVPDRRMKSRAEDIVDSVTGVKDVDNNLRAQKGIIQEVGDRLMGRDENYGYSGSGTRTTPASASSSGNQRTALSNEQNHR